MATVIVGPCDPCCGPPTYKCTYDCGTCENIKFRIPSYLQVTWPTDVYNALATCGSICSFPYNPSYILPYNDQLTQYHNAWFNDSECPDEFFYTCGVQSNPSDVDFSRVDLANPCNMVDCSTFVRYFSMGLRLSITEISGTACEVFLDTYSNASLYTYIGGGYNSSAGFFATTQNASVYPLDTTGYCDDTGVIDLAPIINSTSPVVRLNGSLGGTNCTVPSPWDLPIQAF